MDASQQVYYERRLQRALEDVEAKLKELELEKQALQRQLRKARQENSGLADVNRKNSIRRVMIENRVTDELKLSKKPIHTDALYRLALVVDFQMKESTFRTYLHRMKNKGMIANAGRGGLWQIALPPNTEEITKTAGF